MFKFKKMQQGEAFCGKDSPSVIPGADFLLQAAVIHLADGGHGHGADKLVGYGLYIFLSLIHI